MKWVVWRQYRLELIIELAILVVFAAFIIPVGLDKHAVFNSLGLANMSPSSAVFGQLSAEFAARYDSWRNIVRLFSLLARVLVGTLLAASVVLEFEQRTYRLAWTQSITRGRWLACRLGAALLALVVFSAVLSALTGWWFSPDDQLIGPFDNFMFHGMAPVAYGVFAFAVAILVGTLSRRTSLAIFAALIVCIVAVISIGTQLRPYYMAPVKQVTPITTVQSGTTPGIKITGSEVPNTAWGVKQYLIDAAGHRLDNDGLRNSDSGDTPTDTVVEYQPASRFWPFQGIESAIFLALSVALAGSAVWVVKRQMT